MPTSTQPVCPKTTAPTPALIDAVRFASILKSVATKTAEDTTANLPTL